MEEMKDEGTEFWRVLRASGNEEVSTDPQNTTIVKFVEGRNLPVRGTIAFVSGLLNLSSALVIVPSLGTAGGNVLEQSTRAALASAYVRALTASQSKYKPQTIVMKNLIASDSGRPYIL